MGRPLRGALVGYGFIAEHGHAPEYQRLAAVGSAQIHTVADVTEARREAAPNGGPTGGANATSPVAVSAWTTEATRSTSPSSGCGRTQRRSPRRSARPTTTTPKTTSAARSRFQRVS